MVANLDVFTIEKRESKWVGCAETLAKALELATNHGVGSYFVFSQRTEDKSYYKVAPEGIISPVEETEVGGD